MKIHQLVNHANYERKLLYGFYLVLDYMGYLLFGTSCLLAFGLLICTDVHNKASSVHADLGTGSVELLVVHPLSVVTLILQHFVMV